MKTKRPPLTEDEEHLLAPELTVREMIEPGIPGHSLERIVATWAMVVESRRQDQLDDS